MPPRDPSGRSSLWRSSCSHVQRNLEGIDGWDSSAAVRWRAASPDVRPTGIARGAPSRSTAHRRICRSCHPRSRRRAAATRRRDCAIEPEQVADRVAVFGPVQPMTPRRCVRDRACGPRAIKCRLRARPPRRDTPQTIGPGRTRRRHRLCAKFFDDALPDFGVCCGVCCVQLIEREAAGAGAAGCGTAHNICRRGLARRTLSLQVQALFDGPMHARQIAPPTCRFLRRPPAAMRPRPTASEPLQFRR